MRGRARGKARESEGERARESNIKCDFSTSKMTSVGLLGCLTLQDCTCSESCPKRPSVEEHYSWKSSPSLLSLKPGTTTLYLIFSVFLRQTVILSSMSMAPVKNNGGWKQYELRDDYIFVVVIVIISSHWIPYEVVGKAGLCSKDSSGIWEWWRNPSLLASSCSWGNAGCVCSQNLFRFNKYSWNRLQQF